MPDKANKTARERKKDSKKSDKTIYSSKHIRQQEELTRKMNDKTKTKTK